MTLLKQRRQIITIRTRAQNPDNAYAAQLEVTVEDAKRKTIGVVRLCRAANEQKCYKLARRLMMTIGMKRILSTY